LQTEGSKVSKKIDEKKTKQILQQLQTQKKKWHPHI
jgi:DNA-binding TFAR19-related protein (PDSD5 family)